MLDPTRWAVVRGHEVFSDTGSHDRCWVLPSAISFAVGDGGIELQLMLYRSAAGSGGVLTATLQAHVADPTMRVIASDLARLCGRPIEVVAAPIESMRVTIGDGPMAIVADGRPGPDGRLVLSSRLDVPGATLLRHAIEQSATLPVRAQLTVAGRRSPVDAVVTIDPARATATLASLGDDPVDEAALSAALPALLEAGGVAIESSGGIERAMDAALLAMRDVACESVGLDRFRPRKLERATVLDLRAGGDMEVRRARSSDLATMLAGHDARRIVREVDLDDDPLFRVQQREVHVLGSFADAGIASVVVELRSGGREVMLVFDAEGQRSVRLAGSDPVELRTIVHLQPGDDAIGDRTLTIETPWRGIDDQVIVLPTHVLAPVWTVEVVVLVDWSKVPLAQVTLRYADPEHGIDDRRDALVRGEPGTATFRVRPHDSSHDELEVHAVLHHADGSQGTITVHGRAPGPIVVRADA